MPLLRGPRRRVAGRRLADRPGTAAAVLVSRANPDRAGAYTFFGVPDLVVELLGEDNDEGEDLVKKSEDARAGVRHYWLVRLTSMTLEVSVLGADGRYHAAAAGPLLPLEGLPVPEDLR